MTPSSTVMFLGRRAQSEPELAALLDPQHRGARGVVGRVPDGALFFDIFRSTLTAEARRTAPLLPRPLTPSPRS